MLETHYEFKGNKRFEVKQGFRSLTCAFSLLQCGSSQSVSDVSKGFMARVGRRAAG